MSILLGAWQFDDQLPTSFSLSKMFDAVKLFPFDRYEYAEKQQVSFGNLIRYNTPESINETPPVYFAEKEILISAQGRLDNRKQLSEQMNIQNSPDTPDSQFVLQAYLKWGKESVHFLRGDWSFAIFDYRQQELFIARDPLGYTSLFYYIDHTGFYFSSSVKCLLAVPSHHKQLNELHFISHLTLWNNSKSEHDTYFKDIQELPTSHSLSIRDKKIAVHKYWNPGNCTVRSYKNKQQYVDEVSELFYNAVRNCLRSNKPVASMLSGGLDSSTVSYTAAEILKGTATLTTFSHVPLFTDLLKNDKEGLVKNLDETPFIKKIVHASGNISPQFLNSENRSLLKSIEDFLDIYTAPVHAAANVYWLIDLYATSVKQGFGTLLTGEGGNGSISFAGVDHLRPIKLSMFTSSPYRFVRRQILGPVKRSLLRRLSGVSAPSDMELYANQIFATPNLLKQFKVIEDIRENKKSFRPVVSDVRQIKELYVDLYKTRSTAGAAFGHFFGMELRDPFTNRDLMDYFFSIPNEAFFDDHYNNRILVKRMMKDKIPDEVLFAKKVGLQSADISHRVKSQGEELSDAISAVSKSPAANHYIDTKKLFQTFQISLKEPYVAPYQVQRTLKALQFALFLQKHFG